MKYTQYYLRGDGGEVRHEPCGFANQIQINDISDWEGAVDKFKKANVDFSTIRDVDIFECNTYGPVLPSVKNLTFYDCESLIFFNTCSGTDLKFERCTFSKYIFGEKVHFDTASFIRCTFKNMLSSWDFGNIENGLKFAFCTFEEKATISCQNANLLVLDECRGARTLEVRGSVEKFHVKECGDLASIGKSEGFPTTLKELKIENCASMESMGTFPDTLQELNIGRCFRLKTLPKFSSASKNVKLTLSENLNLLELDMNMASLMSFALVCCPRLTLVGYVNVQQNCAPFIIKDCWSLSFKNAVRYTMGVTGQYVKMRMIVGDNFAIDLKGAIGYAHAIAALINMVPPKSGEKRKMSKNSLPEDIHREMNKMLNVEYFRASVVEEKVALEDLLKRTRKGEATTASTFFRYFKVDQNGVDSIVERIEEVRGEKLNLKEKV
jgi:hypothetical protein